MPPLQLLLRRGVRSALCRRRRRCCPRRRPTTSNGNALTRLPAPLPEREGALRDLYMERRIPPPRRGRLAQGGAAAPGLAAWPRPPRPPSAPRGEPPQARHEDGNWKDSERGAVAGQVRPGVLWSRPAGARPNTCLAQPVGGPRPQAVSPSPAPTPPQLETRPTPLAPGPPQWGCGPRWLLVCQVPSRSCPLESDRGAGADKGT